jgi:hypothetical protein
MRPRDRRDDPQEKESTCACSYGQQESHEMFFRDGKSIVLLPPGTRKSFLPSDGTRVILDG